MNALKETEKITVNRRRTGRTESILIKVASAVLAGEGNVMIACLNMNHGIELLDRLQKMFETQNNLVIVRKIDHLEVNGTKIRVVSTAAEPGSPSSFERTARWFADHSVGLDPDDDL